MRNEEFKRIPIDTGHYCLQASEEVNLLPNNESSLLSSPNIVNSPNVISLMSWFN